MDLAFTTWYALLTPETRTTTIRSRIYERTYGVFFLCFFCIGGDRSTYLVYGIELGRWMVMDDVVLVVALLKVRVSGGK